MRFFTIAVIVLAGFSRVAAANDHTKPEAAARRPEENDIREVVFRYEFHHNASIQGQSAAVYCLSVGEESADPPDDFMGRFTGFKPPVRKLSECNVDPYKGVTEKRTGRSGLVFRVKTIKWKSETEVVVTGGYYEDGLSASGNTYIVRKERRRWRVSKGGMDWLS